MNPINIFEYERFAQEKLPREQYDFIAGGATDEITIRRTREIWDSILLRPRMLEDVSKIDITTTVLGMQMRTPIMIDPAGDHARAHLLAESATAKASAAEGLLMFVSSAARLTLEQIAEAASGPKIFQQYLYRDPELSLEFANRATEAGYKAICITVDSKVKPKRERNIRNKYVSVSPPNYDGMKLKPYSWDFTPDAPAGLNDIRDPGATWKHLDWFVKSTSLPVVLKGIMTAEDAILAVEHGASGIIVSNHGGRQLDTTYSTIEVLPGIVDAVNDGCEVYMDGGIRRGSDVLKALALGARAVLIGRPVFWGLAVNGEDGVRDVIRILVEELEMTMAMCGKSKLSDLARDMLGWGYPLERTLYNP
mgnify:CR=1 FL=1